MSNQYIITYYFRVEIQGTGSQREVTVNRLIVRLTKSSAVAKRLHDALCCWKFCCHSKSLKVIGIGTIRQIAYEFLFVFRSNYGHILYSFRDKAIYIGQKSRIGLNSLLYNNTLGKTVTNISALFFHNRARSWPVRWCKQIGQKV